MTVIDDPNMPQPAKPPSTYYGKGSYQGATPDFNRLNPGDAVAGADNLQWYHTGALGGNGAFGGSDWIQAAPGAYGGTAAPGGGTTAPPGGAPAAPGTSPTQIATQANNAATYSQTPGAAPTANTSNQGTQDVVRNSYLQQATQGTKVDTNDPNFRQQADTFAAGVDRQKRNYLADQAEQAGPYATGAMRGQARMASERAGQAIGGFEADLIGRELTNRRTEIQNALSGLRGLVSDDQARQLQRELAELQAQMQRLGIESSANTSAAGQALQERLAALQNEYNYAQLSQQQRQFGDTLGFNVGVVEAQYNTPRGY